MLISIKQMEKYLYVLINVEYKYLVTILSVMKLILWKIFFQ